MARKAAANTSATFSSYPTRSKFRSTQLPRVTHCVVCETCGPECPHRQSNSTTLPASALDFSPGSRSHHPSRAAMNPQEACHGKELSEPAFIQLPPTISDIPEPEFSSKMPKAQTTRARKPTIEPLLLDGVFNDTTTRSDSSRRGNSRASKAKRSDQGSKGTDSFYGTAMDGSSSYFTRSLGGYRSNGYRCVVCGDCSASCTGCSEPACVTLPSSSSLRSRRTVSTTMAPTESQCTSSSYITTDSTNLGTSSIGSKSATCSLVIKVIPSDSDLYTGFGKHSGKEIPSKIRVTSETPTAAFADNKNSLTGRPFDNWTLPGFFSGLITGKAQQEPLENTLSQYKPSITEHPDYHQTTTRWTRVVPTLHGVLEELPHACHGLYGLENTSDLEDDDKAYTNGGRALLKYTLRASVIAMRDFASTIMPAFVKDNSLIE